MTEALLPQRATAVDAEVTSVEWLFEPYWPGDRLMVRLGDGRLSLTDAAGRPVDEQFSEAAEVLGGAILADAATLDGVWSAQPFVGEGSPARAWAETITEQGLEGELPDPLASERRRAFVALDLLEVDGQSLVEVPFQERRRLLESVIQEGIQVRLSPLVKQPIRGWLEGWRLNGFTRYVAKHMNSRYRPGVVADDWLEIPISLRGAPGFASQMLGRRDRTKRVAD